jgi:hypothetical protein
MVRGWTVIVDKCALITDTPRLRREESQVFSQVIDRIKEITNETHQLHPAIVNQHLKETVNWYLDQMDRLKQSFEYERGILG